MTTFITSSLICALIAGVLSIGAARTRDCIFRALLFCILIPLVHLVIPHGGEAEQAWLDGVIAHLESRRDCDDPRMAEVIDYTIRRYNKIGPFGVKVIWLPDDIGGINSPFVRGVKINRCMMDEHVSVGAWILCHEAMHDWFPNFGHTHIDDGQIWRVVR